jgi:signal transduction histidine kinase
MRDALAKSQEHPGFRMLFAAPEAQFVALSSLMIRETATQMGVFIGKKALARIVEGLYEDSPWNGQKISVEKGLEYNPLRMRSVNECGEAVATAMGRWYERSRVMIGEAAAGRIFEKAYRSVAGGYGYLPTSKNLLGVTPRPVLADEKIRRLHELEMETTAQARSIRAADEDIQRKAERLRQTVTELEETKRQLEVVSQARSEFIDVVAHQFLTPLSSIRWNAELLVDAFWESDLAAEHKEAMGNIRSKSVYLIETLDRVFATLDIETGKVVLDRKPAFLWEVAQDAYSHYEKDIKLAKLEWKFKRGKDQVREIPMDKTKIATVLRILIGNAIGYNKEGGTIAVDVRTEKINGREYQVCSVKDDGIGVPKEDQARVFEKFFRSKGSVLKMADGTGLGMFIVKHYIEAHGGMLWLESGGVDKGTLVAFALPVTEGP